MSKKLRDLCRFANTRTYLAIYKRKISALETIIERELAAGRVVDDRGLSTLIDAHIIGHLEGGYQIKTGDYTWYLSKLDSKVAIDNIKPYFQSKYKIIPALRTAKIRRARAI